MTVRSRTAFLRMSVLAVAIAAAPARAEPTIVGKLNVKHQDTVMTGELRFDLSGGPVTGNAELAVASSQRSPPKRQAGGAARGKFQVRIELDGNYSGGSFGALTGTAKVSGTFTDDAKCQAKVRGTGTFTGTQSGPLGTAEIKCVWDEVEFEGCGLTSPQPFSAALHFTFEPTNVVPKLHVEAGPAGTGAAGPADHDSPAAAGSRLGWWIMGGSAVLVVIGVGGIVISRRLRPAKP